MPQWLPLLEVKNGDSSSESDLCLRGEFYVEENQPRIGGSGSHARAELGPLGASAPGTGQPAAPPYY